MEIQIEFGGFYGYHEEYIDCRLEDWGDIGYEYVNWNATFKSYAENWLHRFNNMCNLELDFIGIDSPKFYNFRTDRIIAKVNNADINDLMLFTVNDGFYRWVHPQLQDRSDFISYYDSIDDLIVTAKKNDDDKAILLGKVCNYLIELNGVNEDIYELEYDIIELNDKLVGNE